MPHPEGRTIHCCVVLWRTPHMRLIVTMVSGNLYMKKYLESHVSDVPARRLFKAGYEKDAQRMRHLAMSMYGLLQANLASGLPAVTTEFMSEREYRSCWLASNVLHYLRNNINPLSGLTGRATEPLLRQIISDADSAFVIPSGEIKAHGYFGHAETLLPLFSLLCVFRDAM